MKKCYIINHKKISNKKYSQFQNKIFNKDKKIIVLPSKPPNKLKKKILYHSTNPNKQKMILIL